MVNSIEQKLEIQWEICSHRNFDFKRPYLVNGAKFFDFGSRYVVTKFSAVRFWPFLAFMGLFLVIFWVLVVGHSGGVLPKYAPGRLGKRKDWEKGKTGKKERLGKKKIYMYIKNEHVHVTFVNLIFRNFG